MNNIMHLLLEIYRSSKIKLLEYDLEKINKIMSIQRITICSHGYHHSGSMATPALGTRDVRLLWNSWRDIEGRGKNCEGRTARGDQRGENCERRTAGGELRGREVIGEGREARGEGRGASVSN